MRTLIYEERYTREVSDFDACKIGGAISWSIDAPSRSCRPEALALTAASAEDLDGRLTMLVLPPCWMETCLPQVLTALLRLQRPW
ncbi:hypothetical protein [Corynebacterium glutamicum]|uniref:hypothetical protein n=1 Tax=Corynebacterium glutamicum TaxID=1718 RepID=UPI0011778B8A|nr:hypothetical protein [Corynebacterium glutamicum]